MKRYLKRKQFELLHNAVGVMAAKLADVEIASTRENSVVRILCCNQAGFRCQILFTDKHFRILEVSFFSPFHNLSFGVTHTTNLEIEEFDIFISQTNKQTSR